MSRRRGALVWVAVALALLAPAPAAAQEPRVVFDTAPPNPSNSSTAEFTFHVEGDLANNHDLFMCQLDGEFTRCPPGTSGSVTYPNLRDGPHRFEVTSWNCFETCSVLYASATHEWVVDTTAPETLITDAPPRSGTNSHMTLRFTSPEDGASFQCRLDGARFAGCESPVTADGLAVGAHRAEVRAVDRAGNVDPSPAVAEYTVEPDGDGDAVADARDNCRTTHNPGQADGNRDGIGDACETNQAAPPVPDAPLDNPPPPTAPGQPPPAAPAPIPAPPVPTQRTRPRRVADRVVIPFRSGFRLPPGVRRSEACRGVVRLALRVGRRVLAVKTVRLNARCRYSATFRIRRSRLRGVRTATIFARFRGNAVLGAAGRAYPVRLPPP